MAPWKSVGPFFRILTGMLQYWCVTQLSENQNLILQQDGIEVCFYLMCCEDFHLKMTNTECSDCGLQDHQETQCVSSSGVTSRIATVNTIDKSILMQVWQELNHCVDSCLVTHVSVSLSVWTTFINVTSIIHLQ